MNTRCKWLLLCFLLYIRFSVHLSIVNSIVITYHFEVSISMLFPSWIPRPNPMSNFCKPVGSKSTSFKGTFGVPAYNVELHSTLVLGTATSTILIHNWYALLSKSFTSIIYTFYKKCKYHATLQQAWQHLNKVLRTIDIIYYNCYYYSSYLSYFIFSRSL